MHTPIMVREIIRFLNIKKNGIYIDCTFGSGGHTKYILSKLDKNGCLIIIDKDILNIEKAKKINDKRIKIFHDNFSNIDKILNILKIKKVNGIIADLGISNDQLFDINRGFSFINPGPLDMRINKTQKLTLFKWLKNNSVKQISKIIYEYSNEKKSYNIAKDIKKNLFNIKNTNDLSNIIKKRVYFCKKHPATRTFLAFRMIINNEINELKNLIQKISKFLIIKGRFCLLTFNSTERNIINQYLISKKNIFKKKKKLFIIANWKPLINEIIKNKYSRNSLLTVLENKH